LCLSGLLLRGGKGEKREGWEGEKSREEEEGTEREGNRRGEEERAGGKGRKEVRGS